MAVFVTPKSKFHVKSEKVFKTKNVNLLLISEVVFSLFLEVLEGILIGTFSAKPSSSSIAEAEATPE